MWPSYIDNNHLLYVILFWCATKSKINAKVLRIFYKIFFNFFIPVINLHCISCRILWHCYQDGAQILMLLGCQLSHIILGILPLHLFLLQHHTLPYHFQALEHKQYTALYIQVVISKFTKILDCLITFQVLC